MNDTRTMSETELFIERLIAAPPEQVYAYWTTPELMVKWFGPETYHIPESDFDVRVGGRWQATMQRPDGTRMTVSGVYRRLEPPRSLEFTWAWLNDEGARGHETIITITCETAPGGTRLTLWQREFATADQCERHREGWNSTFNKLARLPR